MPPSLIEMIYKEVLEHADFIMKKSAPRGVINPDITGAQTTGNHTKLFLEQSKMDSSPFR